MGDPFGYFWAPFNRRGQRPGASRHRGAKSRNVLRGTSQLSRPPPKRLPGYSGTKDRELRFLPALPKQGRGPL
eukprot:4725666-Alexandrium_andersonii.AAC.1